MLCLVLGFWFCFLPRGWRAGPRLTLKLRPQWCLELRQQITHHDGRRRHIGDKQITTAKLDAIDAAVFSRAGPDDGDLRQVQRATRLRARNGPHQRAFRPNLLFGSDARAPRFPMPDRASSRKSAAITRFAPGAPDLAWAGAAFVRREPAFQNAF